MDWPPTISEKKTLTDTDEPQHGRSNYIFVPKFADYFRITFAVKILTTHSSVKVNVVRRRNKDKNTCYTGSTKVGLSTDKNESTDNARWPKTDDLYIKFSPILVFEK